MVLSYYLFKVPYTIVWEIRQALGLNKETMLYCANTLDYHIFSPVQRYLKPLKVIAKDKEVQNQLREMGIESTVYPVFPKGVIMCRQAGYKFPASRMIKIGMRHGAYTFKPFANTKGYNLLDHFYMTGSREVVLAEQKGIKCAKAIGFPKLDPFFDGTLDKALLDVTANKAGIDKAKPTVLFTATWDKSGASAVSQWYDKLAQFTEQFNVLVTVHPWTSDEMKQTIKHTQYVYFIDSPDILAYIQLADVCVGDTSSVLAECCALDKPIVTFKLDDGKRTVQEVKQMIQDFTSQIESFDQLLPALNAAIAAPDAKQQQRKNANTIMFDQLDGKASIRAADHIKSLFPELTP